MKLVDKMVLLARIEKEFEDHKLNLNSDLQQQHMFFTDQKKYVKNKALYEEAEAVLQEMQLLHTKHDNLHKKIKDNIKSLLRAEEIIILKRDYDTFGTEIPTSKMIAERSLGLSGEFAKLITSDIGYYSEWRWAGVELNPGDGLFTTNMLACDPLYIYRGNILDAGNVKKQFNKFFAEKRLMFYDHVDRLPQQQLGLAVSINCYEFWPLDPIKQEMQNVYNALRPGGYYIFTYNDCEKTASLDFCTNNFRAYNTKTLMTSMVYGLGFDIIKEQCHNESHSWMVVKKPGDLTSQKLTAPLVAIETPLKSI